MRTSLNEIKQIEDHLFNEVDPQESVLFEARLILNPQFADNVKWQQQTYQLVKQYGRKKLKAELEVVHQQLFTQTEHRSFAQKIRALFSW
jgi:hypothetical protein